MTGRAYRGRGILPPMRALLCRWFDQHVVWLVVVAFVGVVLFAPHGGDVSGWVLKWFLIAAMGAIALTLGLAVFAAISGLLGRLFRG